MHSFSAEKPSERGGRQYHIQCSAGDLAKNLLVPGDPQRVSKIVRYWEEAKEVAYHREFRSVTGRYKGVEISALSSGIGPGCIAIAVNEAANVGVDTFIRVGSTGAIEEGIECGDLVISTAAVRFDGASENYVVPEYPAHANYEVLLALIEAAERLEARYHVGITATTSDFYAGQARPSLDNYLQSKHQSMVDDLRRAKVLNFEMECATLFTLCNLYNLRAGAICAVFANRVIDAFEPGAGEEDCIRVANEAVTILEKWDRRKKEKGKKHLYPSILG